MTLSLCLDQFNELLNARDIQNMSTSAAAQVDSKVDDLLRELKCLALGKAEVYPDSGDYRAIAFASQEMLDMFKRFPEVTCMDTT